MPHLRKRHALAQLEKLTRFSPIIGLLGHRQVGKTTLLESFSKDYRSFDDFDERQSAAKNAKKYLSLLKAEKTVIDESQLVPELFPALKEAVRKNKSPGQYLLSGSVRFTSKASIKESLTGRIQYLELLPLTISEIEQDVFTQIIYSLLSFKKFDSNINTIKKPDSALIKRKKTIETYLKYGGLPGVCFIRDDSLFQSKINDQLHTMLSRDLLEVYPTTLSHEKIYSFLSAISNLQGETIRYNDLKEKTGISPNTQQKLLYALEAIFLIRRIPIEGSQKGFTLLLEDQAESFYFTKNNLSHKRALTHLLYRNIRSEFFYDSSKTISFFQYKTRSGVVIPLALRSEDNTLGFIPIDQDLPSFAEVSAARSFLNAYGNSKIIFFHNGFLVESINDRMASIGISSLV